MSNIVELYNSFKEDVEKKQFVEAQHKTITDLQKKLKVQQEEIETLKKMLINSATAEPLVEKMIITPGEFLIEEQINLIYQRGLGSEITLEDTKKLDLLIKNQKILKDSKKDIKADSKPVNNKYLTSNELIQIAMGKKE